MEKKEDIYFITKPNKQFNYTKNSRGTNFLSTSILNRTFSILSQLLKHSYSDKHSKSSGSALFLYFFNHLPVSCNVYVLVVIGNFVLVGKEIIILSE